MLLNIAQGNGLVPQGQAITSKVLNYHQQGHQENMSRLLRRIVHYIILSVNNMAKIDTMFEM